MGSDHSFDIVSQVDLQEIRNAVTMSQKEVAQRYDFRGSNAKLEWEEKELELRLEADNDYQVKSLYDIIMLKLTKRGISVKAIDIGPVESTPGGTQKQALKVRQGVPQEKGKQIVKFIKDLKLKVQAQIQHDQVRVSAKQIDDLQTVMGKCKAQDFDIALQFVNYR